jgi:hypothetical protein
MIYWARPIATVLPSTDWNRPAAQRRAPIPSRTRITLMPISTPGFRYPTCATPCVLILTRGSLRRSPFSLPHWHTCFFSTLAHALPLLYTTSTALPPLCAGKPSPMGSQVMCPELPSTGAPTMSQADPCSELPGLLDATLFFTVGSHWCRLPSATPRPQLTARELGPIHVLLIDSSIDAGEPVVCSLTGIPSASTPTTVESTSPVSYSCPLPPKSVPTS